MPPREKLLPNLEKVLYSGMIAEGEYVYQFESEFADSFSLPIAIATSSGSAALHIALILSEIGNGDEVITTSMTAEPTNMVILQSGAIPVFADIDCQSGNLDPDSVESLISERTKAIVVVHYAGFPANLNSLRFLADKYGIVLIEDCAHALGSTYNGKNIGTLGDYAIFSFQAIKHMTTVDGGVLTMRDTTKAKKARRVRWFGLPKGVSRTKLDVSHIGFKYNMNNVSAVIGLSQLENIHQLIKKHIENGIFFDNEIANISGFEITKIDVCSKPSYWIYTLLTDQSDSIIKCLGGIGVMASKLHRPNHLHSLFAPFRRNLPGVDTYHKRLVHIPCGWWVSQEKRELIVETLKSIQL
ncbi:MAG: pyridoxal-5'-phosphate-dependent protein [Flavobacteriales bacterium]|nr:pyridoxal-5'-phosphate-dependent protein [Flavobacteriales bacterium]